MLKDHFFLIISAKIIFNLLKSRLKVEILLNKPWFKLSSFLYNFFEYFSHVSAYQSLKTQTMHLIYAWNVPARRESARVLANTFTRLCKILTAHNLRQPTTQRHNHKE